MDRLSRGERSRNMGRIRAKDTAPELAVRKVLTELGVRYRLHRQDLPGRPDIVFSPRRKIILVHGCFWHQHPECQDAGVPKSRVEFWTEKLGRNVQRDSAQLNRLRELGWAVRVIWECEIRDINQLTAKLRAFLDPSETDDRERG